jgi:SAM-dependent methyltransferase
MAFIPPILRCTTVGAPRLFARLYAIDKLIGDLPAPKRILEIGPGLGDLSAHLLERYPEAPLELSEVSSNAAEVLRARFRDESRVIVSQDDLLGRADIIPTFDLVIACEVFEHIENDAAGLRAVGRLMNEGGHFIFSAPCHMKKWQAADVFAGHYRRYERAELIEKLESAGLKVEHLWTFGFPSVNLIQPARQLYYKSRNREQTPDKQTATEKSGIDRPSAMRYAKWAAIIAMLPLFPIESLFWRKDFGDGRCWNEPS